MGANNAQVPFNASHAIKILILMQAYVQNVQLFFVVFTAIAPLIVWSVSQAIFLIQEYALFAIH